MKFQSLDCRLVLRGDFISLYLRRPLNFFEFCFPQVLSLLYLCSFIARERSFHGVLQGLDLESLSRDQRLFFFLEEL